MSDFKGSPTALIADADCTTDGKSLCEKHGVSGYPTIKYGDVGDLKDYQGGRSYAELKKFAEENLGPTCGPDNLDLCDAGTRTKVEDYMKLDVVKLREKIDGITTKFEKDIPVMKKVIGYHKSKGKA
mmetsp:Transcript_36889/g.106413  ORF Transcript_36889/g.106413 Transcript_36889/m.106413 type:complete len:127 (-) Transcript_36889:166-546(-)